MEEEPDLDRRMAILSEVLRVYPAEPHFERAIQLVRDKRDLVNSIVTKARFFEERGQFVEALDQWQILKSIHEKQPGLAFEIDRILQRRDQQALQNSKARWVEQTDKYLEGGDYDRATKTIQHALMEFPQEAELVELKKLVQRHQERAAQAAGLLGRARENTEKASGEQALADLREAYQLDARNSVIRTVLVNTLLEHARKSMETNPSVTDSALQELLELDPGHVPARSLATQLADQRREEFIAGCLSQARRLQTEGDFIGALAIAAKGIAAYPNEPRLQQLQATLNRVQEASQRTRDTGQRVQDATRSPTPVPPVQTGGPPPVQRVAPPVIPPAIDVSATPPPAPSPPLRTPPPPPGWPPTSPSTTGSSRAGDTTTASGSSNEENRDRVYARGDRDRRREPTGANQTAGRASAPWAEKTNLHWIAGSALRRGCGTDIAARRGGGVPEKAGGAGSPVGCGQPQGESAIDPLGSRDQCERQSLRHVELSACARARRVSRRSQAGRLSAGRHQIHDWSGSIQHSECQPRPRRSSGAADDHYRSDRGLRAT